MKSSTKKIGALVAAIVMVCALLVGCGEPKYDTSTPDGALMTQLDALKTGDFSSMPGYDKEIIEQLGISEADIKNLVSSAFGKPTYTVDNVETISDTEAKVTVSGKAVDMSKFLPVVSTDFLAKVTEFGMSSEAANMTQEQLTKKKMELLTESVKAKKSSIELVDVTATLVMEKKDDTWDVSKNEENMNSVIKLLAGSGGEEFLISMLQGLMGGMFSY